MQRETISNLYTLLYELDNNKNPTLDQLNERLIELIRILIADEEEQE